MKFKKQTIYLVKICVKYVFLSIMFVSLVSCNEQEIKEPLKIVDLYGQLKVESSNIVNKDGETVYLRGMSLFWSQWIDKYYNYNCIKWLRDDWKCTVIRAAMGIEPDGYLSNAEREKTKIKKVIEACIDLGIYVIVDWHDHRAEAHQTEAIAFFKEIATEYGKYPNIIYEIYNEPLQISWTDVIKPYSETLIREIRTIDNNNLIIVGTPTWSQDVDIAAANPVEFENIVYALHFYAATHKQWLRDKAQNALTHNIALFASEYGTCESTGDGLIDYEELDKWFTFMDTYQLSWCNWSIADKEEAASAIKPGADADGNWNEEDLTESGKIIREKIRSSNESIFNRLN